MEHRALPQAYAKREKIILGGGAELSHMHLRPRRLVCGGRDAGRGERAMGSLSSPYTQIWGMCPPYALLG